MPDDISVSPGLKLGRIPVVTALSFKTGLPASFLHKEPITLGPAAMQKVPI
ncbi:MAG: hypothetical protein VX745_10590 [Pseudomonadota bacterium]|nr:hypothetical protein [Pseudomonadota bacterium]